MVVDTVRILVGNRVGIVGINNVTIHINKGDNQSALHIARNVGIIGDAFEMQGVTCCVAIELIVFLDEFTLPRLTLYNLFKSIVKHI